MMYLMLNKYKINHKCLRWDRRQNKTESQCCVVSVKNQPEKQKSGPALVFLLKLIDAKANKISGGFAEWFDPAVNAGWFAAEYFNKKKNKHFWALTSVFNRTESGPREIGSATLSVAFDICCQGDQMLCPWCSSYSSELLVLQKPSQKYSMNENRMFRFN